MRRGPVPSEKYFDQQAAIAKLKGDLLDTIAKSGEQDVSILIATLVELLKRVSDWNLEAEAEAGDDAEG